MRIDDKLLAKVAIGVSLIVTILAFYYKSYFAAVMCLGLGILNIYLYKH
jgi:hypothetical protein